MNWSLYFLHCEKWKGGKKIITYRNKSLLSLRYTKSTQQHQEQDEMWQMCTNAHLKNQEHFSFLDFRRSILENVLKTVVCTVGLGMFLPNTQGPCCTGPAGRTGPPTATSTPLILQSSGCHTLSQTHSMNDTVHHNSLHTFTHTHTHGQRI